MKLIDLNFHVNKEFGSLAEAVESHRAALGFVDFVKNDVDIEVIKHIGQDERTIIGGVCYRSFRSKPGFFLLPLRTLLYAKSQKPDVVLVQSFLFPIQVIFLRFLLGKKCLVLAQHHAEGPLRRKRIFQQLADRSIDAYLFTSLGNAQRWLDTKIISSKEKCYELQEGSTFFEKKDKTMCKSKLSLAGDLNFLYVGNLDNNKDPLTVLSGFEQFLANNEQAMLYMIYRSGDLLEDAKEKISQSSSLSRSVILVGEVDHKDLEDWYNAADFFISASHSESTGYALLESMACGCIPVVTDIPSFRKITGDGQYGFLFPVGDAGGLHDVLVKLKDINRGELSRNIVAYFSERCSYKAIADGLYRIIKNLQSE